MDVCTREGISRYRARIPGIGSTIFSSQAPVPCTDGPVHSSFTAKVHGSGLLVGLDLMHCGIII